MTWNDFNSVRGALVHLQARGCTSVGVRYPGTYGLGVRDLPFHWPCPRHWPAATLCAALKLAFRLFSSKVLDLGMTWETVDEIFQFDLKQKKKSLTSLWSFASACCLRPTPAASLWNLWTVLNKQSSQAFRQRLWPGSTMMSSSNCFWYASVGTRPICSEENL